MRKNNPDILRKENERPEILVRRFARFIQEIGLPKIIKETKEYKKPLNRRARRELALRIAKIRQEKKGYKVR